MSYLLNIKLRIPNTNFSEKSAFGSGLLFLRDISLFSNLSCLRPNPYTRMCVSTIGPFSLVDKIMKNHGKTQVEI